MSDVELRYFDSCPHWQLADSRLQEAIAQEGFDAEITYTKVQTAEDADRLDFIGSPSIVIKGVDVWRPRGAEPGLACRMYATDDGPQGSPTVKQLRAALTDLL